jgi:hypothetical protein
MIPTRMRDTALGRKNNDNVLLHVRDLAEQASAEPRPNSSLNPSRPGFGPGLKPLGRTVPARRHASCRSRVAIRQYARQLPRRGTSARRPWPRRLAIEPLGRRISIPAVEVFL